MKNFISTSTVVLLILLVLIIVWSCKQKKAETKAIDISTTKTQYDEPAEDVLIYENSYANQIAVEKWVMEGPGQLEFKEGWMHMHAHDWKWYQWLSNPGHHVFWCPVDFPDRFIAEWKAQNFETDAGLCIVFFAAKGISGEDIFDPALPKRNGTFKNYTKGKINSYHISYYANNPQFESNRRTSNLRKNSGFFLAQTGNEGIPTLSEKMHKMRLIKDCAHIIMYVDDKKIIDWTDDGKEFGPVFGNGKIGFRQMRWSHFRYRDFKVWSIKGN